MSTAEFNRRAGSNVHDSTEDPSMQLVGDVVPDWVRLPPELGGGRRTVLAHKQVECPCRRGHKSRELALGEHQGKQLFVAECKIAGQFLWYARGK